MSPRAKIYVFSLKVVLMVADAQFRVQGLDPYDSLHGTVRAV